MVLTGRGGGGGDAVDVDAPAGLVRAVMRKPGGGWRGVVDGLPMDFRLEEALAPANGGLKKTSLGVTVGPSCLRAAVGGRLMGAAGRSRVSIGISSPPLMTRGWGGLAGLGALSRKRGEGLFVEVEAPGAFGVPSRGGAEDGADGPADERRMLEVGLTGAGEVDLAGVVDDGATVTGFSKTELLTAGAAAFPLDGGCDWTDVERAPETERLLPTGALTEAGGAVVPVVAVIDVRGLVELEGAAVEGAVGAFVDNVCGAGGFVEMAGAVVWGGAVVRFVEVVEDVCGAGSELEVPSVLGAEEDTLLCGGFFVESKA